MKAPALPALPAFGWAQQKKARVHGRAARWRDGAISVLACAMLLFAHAAHTGSSARQGQAGGSLEEGRFLEGAYVKLFRGPHVPKKLSEITITRTFQWEQTKERIGVFAFGTKVRDFLKGALTIEWEALYADHWGTQDLHEIGAVLYLRWNRFPWNDYIRTTFQVGMGPSLTDRPAHYEPHNGTRSLWLAQLNFEIDVYSPAQPGWALVFRIQHRSGIYKLINRVRGGSNFLTIGLRRQY